MWEEGCERGDNVIDRAGGARGGDDDGVSALANDGTREGCGLDVNASGFMDGRFDPFEAALKQAEDGFRSDIIGGRAGTAGQKQEGNRVEIAGSYHRLRDAQSVIRYEVMPRDMKTEVRESLHGEFAGTILALSPGAAG